MLFHQRKPRATPAVAWRGPRSGQLTGIYRRVPKMTPATAAMIIAAAIAVRGPIGSPATAAPSTTAINGLTNAPVDARVGPACTSTYTYEPKPARLPNTTRYASAAQAPGVTAAM